jgi:hypothetical protein
MAAGSSVISIMMEATNKKTTTAKSFGRSRVLGLVNVVNSNQ